MMKSSNSQFAFLQLPPGHDTLSRSSGKQSVALQNLATPFLRRAPWYAAARNLGQRQIRPIGGEQ